MKYSLGLQGVDMNIRIWTDDSPEPGRYDARIILVFVNGTQDKFLRAYLESMTVSIAGITPEDDTWSTREIRILPRNSRSFRSPYIMKVPTGDNIQGEVSYSVIYGPPGGFPAYRRTHKLSFGTRQILNPGITDLGGVNWQDLEPEADEDLPDGAPSVAPVGPSAKPEVPTTAAEPAPKLDPSS